MVELTVAPVTTSLMGKGCFPEDHPLSLGMIGMHGTSYANYAVSECDLLIAIGARFSNRVTGDVAKFAPEAKIIHIDIDPAEIGKNVRVDTRVVGDLKNALTRLVERISAKQATEWQDKIALWKKEYPLSYNQECGLKPQYVIEQISELTRDKDTKICTEVGQHQMWASHYYTSTTPRSFITSGGLGTMGFGFPASIGAQVGCPDSTVFNIAGDGSIQMNIQELATAVQYELPVNVAILNNGYLGMVRQWQELFYKGRYSSVDLSSSPDFTKVAEAYGAEGIKVTEVAQVRPALEQAIASSKPVFLDFIVEKEENVFPMVPPGGTLNKMIGG